ncbi:Translation initiation factor IF3-4 [Populus alba x Populus x berolinensis]|nr:Translation initiation factor IF3-4 [Populus alba x Populus x berolinensis]
MAGITSTSGSSCFPLLTRITATKMTPLLFGLRSHTSPSFVITSHYGGPRSYGDSRRPRKSDSDEDQALDKSRIGSATVRLIDQQQNMVGVVSVREAIQMAEVAELDLKTGMVK